jgi:integrase
MASAKTRERGQLVKKGDGKYLIRVYLGRDKGKRRYASQTVTGSKKDADARLVKWLREMDTDTFVKPQENVTVSRLLDEWLSSKTDVEPGTRKGYQMRVDKCLKPHIGFLKLSQVSEERLERLFQSLAQVYGRRTLQQAKTVLTQAWKLGVRRNYVARNPVSAVNLPKHKGRSKGAHVTLTAQETNDLLRETAGDRYGALWGLLLGTGMRPQEACALQWGDVDFANSTATIRRVLRDWSLRSTLRAEDDEGKTRGAFGTLHLPKSVLEALKAHRLDQLAERLASGKGSSWNPEGWLFVTRAGIPVLIGNVQEYWAAALVKAGVERKIRLYATRHTHATHLLEAGTHPKVVQDRLRHSTIATTMDTYSHLTQEMASEAADVFDAIREQAIR